MDQFQARKRLNPNRNERVADATGFVATLELMRWKERWNEAEASQQRAEVRSVHG